MIEGARRRQKAWWYVAASVASWLLASWTKRPPTAEQLLGWRPDWWRR